MQGSVSTLVSGTSLWKGLALTAVLLAAPGCSSNNWGGNNAQNPSTSLALTVNEPDAALAMTLNGDTVDSVEANGYDSSGKPVYGPYAVDIGTHMSFPQPPSSIATIRFDYLRNHGYPLYTVTVAVPSGGSAWNQTTAAGLTVTSSGIAIENPNQLPLATAPTSTFTFSGNGTAPAGYALVANYPDVPNGAGTNHTVVLKGVCYSPSPIGFNINYSPALSDFFWDLQANSGFWQPLWANVTQTDRGDIDDIRNNLHCNAIRVYAMMAHQLQGSAGNSTATFNHQAFLDRCWNNGHNPIFVMADFPMPEFQFFKNDPPDLYGATWWENNLTDTATLLGTHPALLGMNIMNEHIALNRSFKTSAPLADANTDYFYTQCEKFIKDLKGPNLDNGPLTGKLVGWAINDNPVQVNYINTQNDVSGTRAYADYLKGFDYWGVNTYQPSTLAPVLSPTGLPPGQANYAMLNTTYQKPTIFTEIGWSAAGTSGSTLTNDTTISAKVGNVITEIIGSQAYDNSNNYSPRVFVGAFYFEYSDEWWKTSPTGTSWVPTSKANQNGVFPNGWDTQDEAAFGLNGVALGAGRNASLPNDGNGPTQPLDVLTRSLTSNPRKTILDALSTVYKTH